MQDEYLLKKANKKYSAPGGKFYTVFRVGLKFKHNPNESVFKIEGLKGLEYHNLRRCELKNVDKSKTELNRILIGTEKMQEDIYAYLEGVKIYKNSNIAREIVLSAGNGFWDKMSSQEQERWIQQNVKFLKDNFGENCVHAILHLDEATPHIHAIVVAVDYSKKIPILRSNKYFDGKEKMSAWQDKYTDAMTEVFPRMFKRGIRGSKATHVDLKTYYALVKEDLDSLSSESILAHAKENFISQKKIQELQETLNNKEEMEKLTKELMEKNQELNKENKIFELVIKGLADKYEIPKQEVIKIIQNLEQDKNDKGIGRER